MKTKFKINTYKEKLYFWVIIYDTLQEFKDEVRKHEKKIGNKYRYVGELGLFNPYKKWVFKDGKHKKSNDIGTIRLIKDKLYPRNVYHELVHAALWQYRLKHRNKANFGEFIDKREEEFAHIYNQLLSKAIAGIYKFKLWK